MAEEDALKLYWEYFFKAETGTYEKSTWLDLFLAEFLIRVNDGANPKELINFCPISGVVSLVGCELLCGIHRVTSSVNTHCTLPPTSALQLDVPAPDADQLDHSEPKPEDPRLLASSALTRATALSATDILRQYLLRGTAWRCLQLLKALGVEGMSCCRQLSSVLIWVFGEMRGASRTEKPAPTSSQTPTPTSRTPIHQLFSHKIWAKQKVTGSQGPKNNAVSSSDRNSARSRYKSQLKQELESKSKRKHSKQSEQSSESADSNDELAALNRSLAIKVSSPSDDFHYFDSPIRTANDYPNETLYGDPFYVPRKPKPKADDYMNEKHREIINSEITVFEFTLLIIDLLQELCKTESCLSGSEGSQVSVQCINFSLRNLCSLQFGSSPHATQYSTEEISRVKVALTELLIVSLDKVLVHADLCAKLINNGILPMLLRLLEDVVCKCSNCYKDERGTHARETHTNTESGNLLRFVFGVAYSVTAFFHCLLMQCRSVEKLRAFTDQFKLYGECLKGDLLKECIELMIRIPADEEETVLLIKKLIESVGKLIVGMKRIRSEVIHSAACPRGRHKACARRVAGGAHHHHGALGEARALPGAARCAVAVLYGTLASLLTDDEVAAQPLLRNKILRTMLNSGVCCCFSPGFLMESIVRLMLTHSSVATLCLQVLEHTVYGELGASILVSKVSDQLPCSICEPTDDKRDLIRKYCPHGVSSVDRKSMWSFLIHYNSLLQLDNHNNVLHATVSHLLRVTPRCRREMKYELLFSVMYPTFIVAKHRYIIRMEEAAYFLTVSCLNIFASLLTTVSFAEQFIQKGGLSYVLELVSLSEFSNQCCSILEIAIIVEIYKLTKEHSEMTFYREMSSLASVQMLFKSLSEVTDRCFRIYKMKLPVEKFEELSDVTKVKEALSFKDTRTESVARQVSAPRPIKLVQSFANMENVEEESVENFLEVIKNVWTFWKCCAALCVYSPMFRGYLAADSALLDSYGLLKLLLYYVCSCECTAPEMRILIKIIESVLAVQLALSDMTMGRSKDTCCSLVRSAVRSAAAAGAGAGASGAGLRALCEALIRVSGGVVPRTHHAKYYGELDVVPPLGCESETSSASGSSSEESASGPYASEHSELTTPDPGYEADVEIGKLEFLTLDKSRKVSGLSIMNSISGYSPPEEAGELECLQYCKEAELAHPELCIIVVDVLTQLIHKLLSSPCESGQPPAERASLGLARACCARLASALSASRAPPPPLLPKLLAPSAAQLLTSSDHHLQDLQRSILELIHVVASQSITSSELAAFLRLFLHDNPPLGALLTTLQRLANAAQPPTPDCILSFPVDSDDSGAGGGGGGGGLPEEYVVVSSTSSHSQHADLLAGKLRDAHLRAGISSPWAVGAVRCGVEGVGWAPWLQGFSLLLWLRTAPAPAPAPAAATAASDRHSDDDWDTAEEWPPESQEPEQKSPPPKKESSVRPAEWTHVISLGSESLVLELWLDTTTGALLLRLSRPDAGSPRVLSEARLAEALPAQRWASLALNVTERVVKRRIHIQVTVLVNGREIETVSLPIQGILVRKVSPTLVLVGHAGRGARSGAYHLSHAHVYRAPLMTVYTALHLTAHSPDHSCQVRCEGPNYSSIITPETLNSDIDWDQVYEISSSTLRELHENLLLTFAAHAPNIMNLYHQTVSLPTGRVATTVSLMGSAAGVAGSTTGGASVPETLFVTWTGKPLPSTHRGLGPAVFMLGGTDVLLYLFARVVELRGGASEQAAALGVVLRASGADSRLRAALYEGPALDMLHTVFASSKCVFSHHMLKVVLDEACSGSLLSCSGNTLLVSARSDAVVLEPRLLLLLLKAWRHLHTAQELSWEVEGPGGSRTPEQGSLWALTLSCLRSLVWDEHPRRAFNQYQMTRVRVLQTLLSSCKERFLNSECGPLEPAASASLVELVRGLMGSPPQLDRLVLLCDFLLLMHQASDTFVTHSRANFYFLLTSETQESSELTLRRAARGSRRRPRPRPPRLERSSSSPASDDELLASVDSSKQLKGLINMQIKEGGRKHTVSSTSENSDINIERLESEQVKYEEQSLIAGEPGPGEGGARREPAGGEGEGETDTLKEYIVVDVDEIDHTTVDMYSSGIYHQRKVKAGAEPGWSACEGLLLLLRDTINVLPEQALTQAVVGAVQAEVLIVLGNHRSGRVRAALVQAMAALAGRAPPDLARKLRAQAYYTHLANQLALYPATWRLASACAALLTQCHVPLQDQLHDDIWLDLAEDAVLRAPPLLALLPGCLRDVPLAHNITLIVRRIIEKASLKTLTEISVAEVVVRAIRGVGLLGETDFEGRDLLLEDLIDLLNRLAMKALSSQPNSASVVELHHMLTYVEWSATARGEAGAATTARAAQVALFLAQLEQLEERLQGSYAPHSKYANYFSSVLSSAVSLAADAGARADRADLAACHRATVVRAVNFLLSQSPRKPALAEAPLVDRLFATLLPAAQGTAGARTRWWVSSGADWVSPLQELWWWAAAPAAGVRPLQAGLLRALYRAPPPALPLLAPSDPPAMRKLAVYLLSMLQHMHAEGESGRPAVELAITDWARGWAVGTQAGLAERLPSASLAAEAERLLDQDEERWAKLLHKQRANVAKVVFSKEALASKVTEVAMWMTRSVVDLQNAERRAFMEQLRRAHSDAVAATQRWHRLIDAHTHDQALWHDPRKYPASWQLDASEGPGRVRVRLRRAHLDVHPRFLKPDHRYKLEAIERGPPLRSVIGGGAGAGLRGGLVARLQLHETVSYMTPATYVTVASDTPGELLLSDRCIHFVPEDVEEATPPKKDGKGKPPERKSGAQSWPLEAVVQVATRRWCLQERAVELFLSSGHAHLIAFADVNERTAFLKALGGCHLPGRTEPDTLAEAMAAWRSGQITNWEYLVRLNGLAGRTYNDLMQYPVLPFVLADYTSRILDLNDPAAFRDLRRPMAIQNKSREQHYINTYNDLKAARREGCSTLLSRQPHHYASLYSNSGGVLHYLVRLPPFTELFLHYQDNNFDMPDRTFHSLATTWRLITNDSPTDVKELIPELFYLPELFHNNEGLNLGVRQCGAGVDDVELPPWAPDSRLFTLIHRQALEAPHVSENLPHWIDLVFGYKQTGQAAVDAINVFPHCTYYGFDPNELEDSLDRTAAEAMVRTYGQAPRQLLRAPHPHRAPDLTPADSTQAPVWAGVEGARWGRYCGSPALGAPVVTARRMCAGAARLQPLPAARAAAAPPRHAALTPLHGESNATTGSGGALALVSWAHSDNVVRLKRRRDARPDPLLHVPAIDQITKVSTSCISTGYPSPIVMGLASGRVVVGALRREAVAGGVQQRHLHAHRAPVTDIHVCARAGLLATASADGSIVLWDLNDLSYIRTLPNRDMLPVSLVTISETLCDVASVHQPPAERPHPEDTLSDDDETAKEEKQKNDLEDSDSYEKDSTYKYKSLVRVHTVNARFVGSVKVSELVTSTCYSNAPEGVSVNCLACGLHSGAVALYSSWDLRLLATIPPAEHSLPLVSLTYSSDSSVLFGCYADGLCVAWESAPARSPPRIVPAHALF